MSSRLSFPPSRYPYSCSTKGCSVVFIQLVIRPFWADFDLRDRPPVYKTAALPIELRRRLPEGIASQKPTDTCNLGEQGENGSVNQDVYADDPWVSIRWDREHACVFSEWNGFANSVELRAGMMKIIDVIRERHAASFVSDNQRLEVVTNEDQLWIRDSWTPLAVAVGLKRIAVVLAPRGLGKIASEAVLSQIGKTAFVTRTFGTVSDAIAWVVVEHSKDGSRSPKSAEG